MAEDPFQAGVALEHSGSIGIASQDQVDESEWLRRMRHSAAHVLAQVVLQMFPDGKFAIGPPIDTGFYYDFDLPRPLTPEDLSEIQKRMRKEMRRNHRFVWEGGHGRRGARTISRPTVQTGADRPVFGRLQQVGHLYSR